MEGRQVIMKGKVVIGSHGVRLLVGLHLVKIVSQITD